MTPLMNYHLHQNIPQASIAGVCFGSGDMENFGFNIWNYFNADISWM